MSDFSFSPATGFPQALINRVSDYFEGEQFAIGMNFRPATRLRDAARSGDICAIRAIDGSYVKWNLTTREVIEEYVKPLAY